MSLQAIAHFLSRHFWLWGSAGAVGGLLAYAAAGPSLFVLVGVGAGITPALLGAWYYERRTESLKTIVDLEREGLPMLAAVGWFEQGPSSAHPTDAHSHAWGSYGDLARRLLETAGDTNVFLITSASPEEGKSTTAANLATTLARDGTPVVLIDADLRWSSLRSSSEDGHVIGLSGLLINHSLNPQLAVVSTSDQNLYLLPAGPLPSDPEGLLRTTHLAAILASLGEKAGYIVIDAPPVLEAADATLLAAAADATVLVVGAGSTRRRQLVKARERLAAAGVAPIGAVLNRAQPGTALDDPSAFESPLVARPVPPAWAESLLPGLALVEAEIAAAESAEVDPEFVGTEPEAQAAPRLRLLQPYERPLLPFSDPEHPPTGESETEEDGLEITVDELLVDLEETLSLIRHLKAKHAVQGSTTTPISS